MKSATVANIRKELKHKSNEELAELCLRLSRFKKENKDAYLCSAFFSIDKKGKDNQQHLDFYVPSTKKLFSFKFGEIVQMIPMDIHDERIPEKLSDNFNFNFSSS